MVDPGGDLFLAESIAGELIQQGIAPEDVAEAECQQAILNNLDVFVRFQVAEVTQRLPVDKSRDDIEPVVLLAMEVLSPRMIDLTLSS